MLDASGYVVARRMATVSAKITGRVREVRIEEGMALVNLSGNFYRSCQQMGVEAERNLVYALVNTLSGLNPVNRVRFFIDGQTVDALVTAMSLRGTLMPNPGIVVK